MGERKSSFAVNGVSHFDIGGSDAAMLGKFYATVFGWQLDVKGPGYSLLGTPEGGPNGAIVESESAAVTIGVTVTDLEKTIEGVKAAGGKIIMPVTDNGWVKKAQFEDVAGNLMTVIQL